MLVSSRWSLFINMLFIPSCKKIINVWKPDHQSERRKEFFTLKFDLFSERKKCWLENSVVKEENYFHLNVYLSSDISFVVQNML